PWQASVFGIQRLPPNHGALRLALVQSMPTPLPSGSLSTLVNHCSFASAELNGWSIWQPMNDVPGACSTTRQRYSSSGSVALGIGFAFTTWVAFSGRTAG